MPEPYKLFIILFDLLPNFGVHEGPAVVLRGMIGEKSGKVLLFNGIGMALHVFVPELHQDGVILDIRWRLDVGVLDLGGSLLDLLAKGLEVFQVFHDLNNCVLEGLLLLCKA